MAIVTTTFDIGDAVWAVITQNLSVDNGNITRINITRQIESGNQAPTDEIVYVISTTGGLINSLQNNTYATYEAAVAALQLLITPTPTPAASLTPTPAASASATPAPTVSATISNTPVVTRTPTRTPTRTSTRTPTPTRTRSAAIGASPTPTPAASRTATPVVTASSTAAVTPTATTTPSVTASRTATATPTPTATTTPSVTASRTATATPTPTATVSITPTRTGTAAVTPTVTNSLTPSITPTRTVTPTPTVSVSASSSAPAANPFDALYSGSFQLVSGTTNLARQAQAKPAKMTNLATAGYTDANFGTRIYNVTRVTDVPDSVTNLRHVYSRQQAFNADSTVLAARAGNGWWHIYNANTGQKLNGGRTQTPGLGALNGPANECELTWHPTNPNKLWYTANYGGLTWFEYDITTNTSVTLFNLQPLLTALGGPWVNAARAWWRGEGRPSDDGRWWALQVEDSGFGMIGLIMYDRQNNQIVGSLLTNNRPDHCSTSPLGNYAVVSWYGTAQNLADAALQPVNNASGARAYSRDFSTFTQLSVLGEHSDCALDYSGREVFVSVTYRGGAGGNEPDITDGGLYYRDMATGQGYNLPMNAYAGSSDSALHVSGLLKSKPGWALVSWYGTNGVPTTWKDGTISLVELVPTAPRVLRLAHHYSNYNSNYINEPHASISWDGSKVVFASNFGGTVQEDYLIGLPSWVIPAAGQNISPTPSPTATRTPTATQVTQTPTPTVTSTPLPPSVTPTATSTPLPPSLTPTPTVSPSTPPPFFATTLSPTLKGGSFVLTNGNRTATQGTLGGFTQHSGCSASAKDTSTANFYWEVAVTDTGTSQLYLGLANPATIDPQYSNAGTVSIRNDGFLYLNGNNSYVQIPGASFQTGQTVKFLVKNGKLYAGLVGAGWFNSGNPVAETGFVYDLVANGMTSLAPAYGTLRDTSTNTVVYAFNFGQSAWADTAPAGSTGWPV